MVSLTEEDMSPGWRDALYGFAAFCFAFAFVVLMAMTGRRKGKEPTATATATTSETRRREAVAVEIWSVEGSRITRKDDDERLPTYEEVVGREKAQGGRDC